MKTKTKRNIKLVLWLVFFLLLPYYFLLLPDEDGIRNADPYFSITIMSIISWYYHGLYYSKKKEGDEEISKLKDDLSIIKRQNERMKSFVDWMHNFKESDYNSPKVSSNIVESVNNLEEYLFEESCKEWQRHSDEINSRLD